MEFLMNFKRIGLRSENLVDQHEVN